MTCHHFLDSCLSPLLDLLQRQLGCFLELDRFDFRSPPTVRRTSLVRGCLVSKQSGGNFKEVEAVGGIGTSRAAASLARTLLSTSGIPWKVDLSYVYLVVNDA